MKAENFILINLNQNISRARKVAQKEERDKWIIFGLLCFIFIGLTGWFFQINGSVNSLVKAREDTIESIKTKTTSLKKDAKINLSKGDILASYDLGKYHIPWSQKLIQLTEMTPDNMCITKLIYDTKSLSISAISRIEDENKKEQQILNDFMSSIQSNDDFYKEFDEIKIKKTKKSQSQSSVFLSFEISAQVKKKIKNRTDDIVLKDDKKITKEKKEKTTQDKKKEKKKKKKKKKEEKYSQEIIDLAKSIDINDPDGTTPVKDFQEKLEIYSSEDLMYGVFDSKTVLLYGDVLDIKPETPWEKEKRRIDKVLAGVDDAVDIKQEKMSSKGEKSKASGYDKLTIKFANKIAAQIGAGAETPDIDLIRGFQELTGIADENDSWYGSFNNETIEMLSKVMGME